jgi:large subunit ribosomal protein L31
MKQDTHPTYYKIGAVCVCGNVVQTGSVLPAIKLDICSACHPFFTGTQKLIDTEGRVERFNRKYEKAQAAKAATEAPAETPAV